MAVSGGSRSFLYRFLVGGPFTGHYYTHIKNCNTFVAFLTNLELPMMDIHLATMLSILPGFL